MTIKRRLGPLVSRAFDACQGSSSEGLEPLYGRGFNGGYFWNGALLIRPLQAVSEAPLSVGCWNEPSLWKDGYEGRASLLCFAEDVFGVQYGLEENGLISQFDPETAERVRIGTDVDEWCDQVLNAPEFYTGYEVLERWMQARGPLMVAHRLVPKKLFTLGGDFDVANMLCKPDVLGMKIRAQFWRLTKDLPEGQKVFFEVED